LAVCANARAQGAAKYEAGIRSKRKIAIELSFTHAVFKKCLSGCGKLSKSCGTLSKFPITATPEENKGGDTNVTQSGQGNASGRDTIIGRDVIYGADGRQIGEAVAEAQSPLFDWVKQLSAENAELVRRLEQAREGAQAPGSQQAIAEAVDATAKGAAAGNPRAKQALELLNAGKIAEAVPLFQAEAAEKEATSRRDAKEAAAAYRNLGAIARPRRPEAGAGGVRESRRARSGRSG
jgi:hypothetical protein